MAAKNDGSLRIMKGHEAAVQFAKAAVAENDGESGKDYSSEGVRLTAIGLQGEVSKKVGGIYTS